MEIIIVVGLLVAVIAATRSMSDNEELPDMEICHKPFPPEWRLILEKQWPIYSRLPEDLRNQLEQLTLIFLERIEIRGVEGLEITDEIRVLTASQACILLINQKSFFPNKLRSVVIRPRGYTATQHESYGGITSEKKIQVLGQSWENGLVVLSWDNTKTGARNARDGRNLVIHEFAHQLDQADGQADGTPILGSPEQYAKWRKVCSRVFGDLQRKIEEGEKTLIDEYGATNPAEFFSVVTEIFFEKPFYLKKRRPELYQLFQEYYQVDPLSWK